MDTITKQPGETLLCDMSFDNILGSAESIVSVDTPVQKIWNETTQAWDATTDLTFSAASFAARLLQVSVIGGTDGETYKVTMLATTDVGEPNIIEGDGILVVLEI